METCLWPPGLALFHPVFQTFAPEFLLLASLLHFLTQSAWNTGSRVKPIPPGRMSSRATSENVLYGLAMGQVVGSPAGA